MPSRTPRTSSRMAPCNAALDIMKKRAALPRAYTYPLSLPEYRSSPFVVGVNGEVEVEQSQSFQRLRKALTSRYSSRYALVLCAYERRSSDSQLTGSVILICRLPASAPSDGCCTAISSTLSSRLLYAFISALHSSPHVSLARWMPQIMSWRFEVKLEAYSPGFSASFRKKKIGYTPKDAPLASYCT